MTFFDRRLAGLVLASSALLIASAPAAPAYASDHRVEIRHAADAVVERHHSGRGVTAAASGGSADAIDDMAGDIVSTELRFDSSLVNVGITTRDTPVIDEKNWMLVALSFNNSGFADAIAVAGKYQGVREDIAIGRYGQFCPVVTSTTGDTFDFAIDATCLGKPGAISYSVAYGDIETAAYDSNAAVDYSPEIGMSTAVTEAGGYWLLGGDGGVFSFGDTEFFGSAGNLELNQPVVAMSSMPRGDGYRFVAGDGGVFNYGNAPFHGSMGARPLNRPVVAMSTTASGDGYWLVASDGGIFAFGDASFHGSTGSLRLNAPVVGMAPTPSGRGYWLAAADGGIFAFGDAQFHGSLGSQRLNTAITGIGASTDGGGYNLLAADGGVFSFGNAGFFGAATGTTFGPSVALNQTHMGYTITDSTGTVRPFGHTYNFGDLEQLGIVPNQPIVGMASRP